jgi:hypothetical protein
MNKINQLAILLTIALGFSACKKEYDTPPIKEIPVGSIKTFGDLKAMYNGTAIKFTEDYSVFGVVSMDESTGNLYKNIYVQDNEHGFNVRLTTGGGVYQGDSIRIYLKGVILSQYNGQFQLDSVDVDKNIIKQKTNVPITPVTVSINELGTVHHSRLVRIENVEFQASELGKTYADAVNQSSQNRTIRDCNGNSIIVRTSGYANFANTTIPYGNGSIIAVMSDFNGTKQLYVRRPSEVQFTNLRCDGSTGTCENQASVTENFDFAVNNNDFSATCWTNKAVSGSRLWQEKIFNSDKYVQASAFSSTDASNVFWLISPPVQASASKKLSFSTAKAFYTHDGLEVFISTNYDGANITAATWIPLTGLTIAGSTVADNTFIPSGEISLANFLPANYTGKVYVGFRYTGNAGAGQTGTFRIDNIVIND